MGESLVRDKSAPELIQRKVTVDASGHEVSITGDQPMPTASLLVTVGVVAMFAVFAAALFWGEYQTRPKQLANSSHGKRRAF